MQSREEGFGDDGLFEVNGREKKRSRLPVGDGYNNGTEAGVVNLRYVVSLPYLPGCQASRVPIRMKRKKGKFRVTNAGGDGPTLYTPRRGNQVHS